MSKKNSKISLIICDDHPIFRQGLIRIIEKDNTLNLLGECGDGDSAIELIQQLNPQVAILDITMPQRSGLSVARHVITEKLETKVIILTMHKDEEYLNEAIEIGIQGYLLKDNAVTDLSTCVQRVVSGQHFVSPLLEDSLKGYSQKSVEAIDYFTDLNKLNDLERKILQLIANNKTSQQISKELKVDFEEIQKNRQNIINKLDLYGPYKLYQFALKYKDSF